MRVTVSPRPDPGPLGTVGALLVLAGGLVTAPVPSASWVTRIALRDSSHGRMLGVLAVVAGLGLLSVAWVRLWRAADAGEASLATVRRLTATWCAPLLLAPPMFSRDGWSYVAQGELTRIGLTPYVWGPGVLHGPLVEQVDPRWMLTATPYGPLPLWWGSLAAHVVRDPWALVVAHRLLALAGLALLAWALPRLAAWSGRDGVHVSALVLPCPLLLAHGVAGLHNDLLMVGLGAAALVVAAERGWVLGAVLGGLAAAVKVPGGLVCLGVVLVSLPVAASLSDRVRRLAGAAAVSAATVVAVGALAGVGVGWVGALGVPAAADTPLSVTTLLAGLLPGARDVGIAASFAVVVWVALTFPTGSRRDALRAGAVALTATVLLSPVVHPWYALWCLPLVAACRLGARGDAVLVWVALALGLTATLDAAVPDAYALTAVALVVGSLAVLAVLAWTTRPIAAPRQLGQAAAGESGSPTTWR